MYTALGLMSGTSMDGIDIALLSTNGKYRLERGPFASFAYTDKFRQRLRQGLDDAKSINQRAERPGGLKKLEQQITQRHIKAINRFLNETGLRLSDIDVIGFHGQTVLHKPEVGLTVQLGLGKTIAEETGVPVVCDLRANDMKHGGQGAPLASAYHRALARTMKDLAWPVAFVNIGGIANVTWVSLEGRMIAYDAGPGNVLIDRWVQEKTGDPFDESGKLAAKGKIDNGIVNRYLSDPFFEQAPPKSLDWGYFAPLPVDAASAPDGARSLARLTARALMTSTEQLPEPPATWVISGGGARNPVIMADLAELSGDAVSVITASSLNLNADAIEAEAWAYLAVRCLRDLKITWPGTTGVDVSRTGGVIIHPSASTMSTQ